MSDESQKSCELTGTFGFIVQGVLGILAFAVLIVKRNFEKPKRQLKIWLLDTSKQGISQAVAHVLNVILALILSSEKSADPCNWYFVTIAFDTTLGVGICYVILLLTEKLFDKMGVGRLKTGNYFRIYTPDELMALDEFNRRSDSIQKEKLGMNLIRPVIKIDYGIWFAQLIIWVLVVILSKSLLYLIQLGLAKELQGIANFLFSSLDDYPDYKLVLVMVIIPLCLNSAQFWIQDNFLKKSKFTKIEEQYLSSEMFVNLELQDMLNNDADDINSTNHKNQYTNNTSMANHNNIKANLPIEYEFEQYSSQK